MTRQAPTRQAWVNGVYVAAEEARISPFDRGFLFADGVYEVTAIYNGRTVDMERHLDRLERSLRELKFGTMPDRKELEEVHRRLIADNTITEGYIYLQVTRGAYGQRDFVAPDKPKLTCFAYAESKPLIDTGGNLVGINTAIYSRSGGSLGIGFAIPVNTARQVMEGLVRDGQVTRGWIGVEPRELTPEIAETLRLPVRQGVLITGVLQSGPASEGGLRPGDVVTKVADKPVASTGQLLNAVAALKPRETAVISVQRGERALDLTVMVGTRPKSRTRQPQ